MIDVSDSVTVNSKSLVLSASTSDTTDLLTTSPPSSRELVKAASDSVSLIVPLSPVFVVTKPAASASTTSYVIDVGSPSAVASWPSFSVNSATPAVNSISPYVPSIVLSESVTVKLKSFCLSAVVELTTVFLTVRSPVLRVLVNAAVAGVSLLLIVPVSPVFSVSKPLSAASVTV